MRVYAEIQQAGVAEKQVNKGVDDKRAQERGSLLSCCGESRRREHRVVAIVLDSREL
jgi:hypothetical protein